LVLCAQCTTIVRRKNAALLRDLEGSDCAVDCDRVCAKAGKFWVYEQAIRIPFYAIYEVEKAAIEVYELIGNQYQQCSPNSRKHYPIAPMGVELGIWQGRYGNHTLPWLRWWDSEGKLLLTGEERAERLAEKLQELGIDPETV
jgi:hypothetical protein